MRETLNAADEIGRKELQLERAKQLLGMTFLSIKDIAASVGIDEGGHFVHDFKEVYAMTPAEYAECYRVANGIEHELHEEH